MNPLVLLGLVGTGIYLSQRNELSFGARVNEGDVLQANMPLIAKVTIRNDGIVPATVRVSGRISFEGITAAPGVMELQGNWADPNNISIRPGLTMELIYKSSILMPQPLVGSSSGQPLVRVDWTITVVETGQQYKFSNTFRLPEPTQAQVTILPIAYASGSW